MSDLENLEKEIPELHQRKNFLGRWAGFFIKSHRVAYLVIIAILIWGITSGLSLKRELNPEVILPFAAISTIYNGAAPEEVESLITDKIEKKMQEMEKVKTITSSSGYGYSFVFLEFETGVDIDDMVQKAREKVSAIQKELPSEAENPEVVKFETGNAPIMIINISGEDDFIELKKYADKIKDELEKMKEVSDVQIIGGLEREIKIIVDPSKLAIYGISLEQIKGAIQGSNINFPGGSIELDQKNYNIRTVGQFEHAQELEKVVLTYVGDRPLFLRDIAEIEDGYKEENSYSRMGVNAE